MKKLISGITSLVVGVAMFILGVCPAIKVSAGSLSQTENLYNSLFNMNAGFDIFSILMMIVAGILAVAGIVSILKELNVLKLKFNMSLVNIVVLILLVLSLLGLTISALVFAGDKSIENVLTVSVGVGIWIMDAVAVVGLVLAVLFRNKK